jgi:hypothetical protein
MLELIERLKTAGFSEEQALKAIEIIKNFTKEKFPMFGGAIDGLFKGDKDKNDFLDK